MCAHNFQLYTHNTHGLPYNMNSPIRDRPIARSLLFWGNNAPPPSQQCHTAERKILQNLAKSALIWMVFTFLKMAADSGSDRPLKVINSPLFNVALEEYRSGRWVVGYYANTSRPSFWLTVQYRGACHFERLVNGYAVSNFQVNPISGWAEMAKSCPKDANS